MSIKVMTYVWEHSQQKGSALLPGAGSRTPSRACTTGLGVVEYIYGTLRTGECNDHYYCQTAVSQM